MPLARPASWGIAAALTLAAGNAAAQAMPDLEPVPPGDPKVPAGFTLATIGATSTVAGAIAFAQGVDVQTSCNNPAIPATCFTERSAGTSAAGVALLTTGVSASAFGLLMLRSAAVEDRAYPADNPGMMGSGIVITGIAVGGVIGAQALWIYSAYEDDNLLAAAPVMFLTSGALFGLGVPLWVAGSRPPKIENELSYFEAPIKVRRNPAMMAAGIGMTAAGAAVIGTGIGVGVDLGDDESDASIDMDGAPFFVIGSVLAGGTLVAAGIPLWVKGSRHVPIDDAYADADLQRFAPQVNLGPTAIDLTWRW